MTANNENIITHSKVLEKIKELLHRHNVNYKLIEHEPVFTSEEAAKVRNAGLDSGAKSLVMYADKNPILLVVPGDKRVNIKEFKKQFNVKDLRMATPDQVFELTGLRIGAIPPVGKALSLKSFYDSSFKFKEEISFNPGAHTCSMILNAADLIKIEDPLFADIA